jgi:hypothetical protein
MASVNGASVAHGGEKRNIAGENVVKRNKLKLVAYQRNIVSILAKYEISLCICGSARKSA